MVTALKFSESPWMSFPAVVLLVTP